MMATRLIPTQAEGYLRPGLFRGGGSCLDLLGIAVDLVQPLAGFTSEGILRYHVATNCGLVNFHLESFGCVFMCFLGLPPVNRI